MSSNLPITDSLKFAVRKEATSFTLQSARTLGHTVDFVRRNINDFREKHCNENASRQAIMNGVQKIQEFPSRVSRVMNVLGDSHVRNMITQIIRHTPQPVIIGLAGFAGFDIINKCVKGVQKRFRPKPISPLYYFVPALITGAVVAEHANKYIKDMKRKRSAEETSGVK